MGKAKKRRQFPVKPQEQDQHSADTAEKPQGAGPSSVRRQPPESMIDETLAESFPASDPPSWTLGRSKGLPSKEAEGKVNRKRRKKS